MVFDKDSKVFRDVCSRFAIDSTLVAAVVTVESTWDPHAFRYEPAFAYPFKAEEFSKLHRITLSSELVFQKTSFGLMQIMGGVARELGFVGQLSQLFDPALNLEYGIRYLLTRMRRYPLLEEAIAAYNAGSARRDPLTKKLVNQTYVDKVLNATR